MKRLLSIIATISLVGTSTTSLISCNPKHENTITGNLKLIWPEQGYFKEIDNKWYVAIVRGDGDGWCFIKFKNDEKEKEINITEKYSILLNYNKDRIPAGLSIRIYGITNDSSFIWGNKGSEKYFKNVYQWIWPDEPNNNQLPKIDRDGNII